MQSTNGKRPATPSSNRTNRRKKPEQTTETAPVDNSVGTVAAVAEPIPEPIPDTPPAQPPETVQVAPPTQPQAKTEEEPEEQSTAVQVTVDAELLTKAVERAAAAVSKDNNGSTALRSLLVKADPKNGQLSITGYNLKIWLQVTIEAVVRQGGEFLLHPKSVQEFLKTTGQNGMLHLDSADNPGVLKLSYGGVEYSERISTTDNYPEPPVISAVSSAQHYTLPSSDFSLGLGAVSFAASSEENNLFNGILLQLWRGDDTSHTDGFEVIATDSKCVAIYTVTEKGHDLNAPQHQALLQPQSIPAIRQLCFAAQETLRCCIEPGKLLQIETEVPQLNDRAPMTIQTIVRLKEGAQNFPIASIRQLSLVDAAIQAELSHQQMLAAIQRQAATEATTMLLEVTFDDEVVFKTCSTDSRERQVVEHLSADTKRQGTILLPISQVDKAISKLPCETIRVSLSPGKLASADDGHENLIIIQFIDRPLTVAMTRMVIGAATPKNTKNTKSKKR